MGQFLRHYGFHSRWCTRTCCPTLRLLQFLTLSLYSIKSLVVICHCWARPSHVVLVAVALSVHTGRNALVHSSSPAGRASPVGTKKKFNCSSRAEARAQERTIYPGIQRRYYRRIYTCLLCERVTSIALSGYEEQEVSRTLGESQPWTYEALFVSERIEGTVSSQKNSLW
jgi:hypothetical protein